MADARSLMRIPFLTRYMHWLHTQWPAGTVEKLPIVNDDGSTNVPGLYITGDLTGIPLLKFSADTGAKAMHAILKDPDFTRRDRTESDVLDMAITGGGVSGFSAAIEAKKAGLHFTLYEATEPFSTVVNFPKGKPIFTYPTDMTPSGELQFHEKSAVKEGLLEDLHEQTLDRGVEPVRARVDRIRRGGKSLELVMQSGEVVRAHRVIVAIGRSGNFRKLGVLGEDLDKVYNRLHDPADFCGQNVLVVGGGDSAMETAIALATCGSHVTLSYRKPQFSRPKPENVEKIDELVSNPGAHVDVEEPTGDRVTAAVGDFMGKERMPGRLRLMMASHVKEIRNSEVVITNSDGQDETTPNDAVFTMIGREPPLDFFRRSGVKITGEWSRASFAAFVAFVAFMVWVYHWKANKPLPFMGDTPTWLRSDLSSLWEWIGSWGGWWQTQVQDPSSLLGTLAISAAGGAFYYTLAYSLIIVVFGIRRIRRRKTPYVKVQTSVLMAIQVVPLFLLPEIVLPLMGHNGLFDAGPLKTAADGLFPQVGYGHGREYWRAYGFILAWPLMVWNLFTDSPLWWWIVICFLQTFVIIPLLIYRFGKGAYCGWICSCGALAETLGDAHRHKMPHGPVWNRLNMLGQVFLVFALVLLALRVLGWMNVGWALTIYDYGLKKVPVLSYSWLVDVLWAGIIGYGVYFWYSGRFWCRFACPLAALMHIYARFSRFGIIAEKKKCISCNVCTSVCHQGIDIMNFANKGLTMQDPECVRCSACVQSCPTGVLRFGRVDREGNTLAYDTLPASPVQIAEVQLTINASG